MKFKSARYKAKQKTNKTNLSVLNGTQIKFKKYIKQQQ